MKQALLVIDVQNDYFEQGKMELVSSQQALFQINKLEDFFLINGFPILYIQHLKDMPGADFFGRGTKGALLHADLKVEGAAIIIEKQSPNAFFNTKLNEVLKSLQIEQVVITGMMTHMCVDSTTRASKELGYRPIVISDATATKNLTFQGRNIAASDVQGAFLASLQNFAQVMTCVNYLNETEQK